MKKRISGRSLQLRRETLRQLNLCDLEAVAGGGFGAFCTKPFSGCNTQTQPTYTACTTQRCDPTQVGCGPNEA